jgi:hypothetical protein
MGSDGWIETLLPKQSIQKVLRKLPNREMAKVAADIDYIMQ